MIGNTNVALPAKTEHHRRELPQDLVDWLNRSTSDLTKYHRIYCKALDEQRKIRGQEPRDYYLQKLDEVLGDKPIWVIEGTERVSINLGRTFTGDFIFEDRAPVVVQIQSGIPHWYRDPETTPNIAELNFISKAVERGDGDLFAGVYDAAPDGRWIAREYCTPIYRSCPSKRPGHDWLSRNSHPELFDGFVEEFGSRGYSGSSNDGNIGLASDGRVVQLDVGTHTRYRKSNEPEPETEDQNRSQSVFSIFLRKVMSKLWSEK